jgi:uncharacterized metal-binding protein
MKKRKETWKRCTNNDNPKIKESTMKTNNAFTLEVTSIDKVCAAGEEFGQQCQKEGKTPVFSCEGGCIKGEIARQAANLVAKDDGFARACHGELFTVPHADLAKWVREADKVVVIDGCSLFCHGRIAENIIGKDQLVIVDALSIHRKYANLMDVDDVPEQERKQAAREVADKVLANLKDGTPYSSVLQPSCECGSVPQVASTCSG